MEHTRRPELSRFAFRTMDTVAVDTPRLAAICLMVTFDMVNKINDDIATFCNIVKKSGISLENLVFGAKVS